MRKLMLSLAVLALFVAAPSDASAQKKKKKKGNTEQPAPKKGDKKSFADVTKNTVAKEGLFNMHCDTITGKTFIEISESQFDEEFIYFSQIMDGVLEAGFFRGAYRGSKIITFHKVFDRIEIHAENTGFYFDENNALSKAQTANINVPILVSEKIEAEEEGKYLISADAIFKSEKFQMVKPPSNPMRPGLLGNLSKDKTKIQEIKNYPDNSEICVSYAYDNPNPKRGASGAVMDVRYITVNYQHSLIQMPEEGYVPRKDDARIGFFLTEVQDMTSFSATPYKDMIHRWRLEKKDPSAKISEPVKPIVYWIENTTPEEFRPIIKEGVERWNLAFEKAGFKNAVQVKIQPDDADWDAGDIRYNVLRWTSSPIPPFGGYGPSFVNPRTGEILGADIMLEFASIAGRLFRAEVFTTAGTTDFDQEEELDARSSFAKDMHLCHSGNVMHHNLLFGLHSMKAMNIDEAAQKDFVKQTLYRLVLHEVGHTLGMAHNMRASTMLTLDEIKDKALVAEKGLCNSVMEYPAINFALEPENQTLFYDVKPGPYDEWVIEYGYSEGVNDPKAEAERLENILSRSSDPDLRFGNDADDMRSTGRGINPEVNIYDLSDDPVAYASERCELVNKLMPKMFDSYTEEGENYHELRQAYFVLTGEYGTQLRIMTRQIGGVVYDRSVKGQEGAAETPLIPVAEEKQRAAMKALAKHAFSPNAFSTPDGMYENLYPQRRGWNHWGRNEDPKIHQRILGMQQAALAHLMDPTVVQRIIDSEMYGNTYSLDEVMTDLTNSIYKEDIRSSVNPMRQNLQVEYVLGLMKMVGPSSRHSHVAKGMAWYELNRIQKMMKSATGGNTLTKAHRSHVNQLISDAREGRFPAQKKQK